RATSVSRGPARRVPIYHGVIGSGWGDGMNKGLSRRVFLGAMLAGGAYALLPRIAGAVVPGQARVPGWLLRDVLLVDGTGAPGRRTDVLVRGDSVEHIGRVPDARARGLRVVEGGGRVLAPGFIDLHTHGNPL